MLTETVKIVPLVAPQLLAATKISDPFDMISEDCDEAMIVAHTGAKNGTPSFALKVQDSAALARQAASTYPAGGATVLELRKGTNDNIKIAASFTNAGVARSVKKVGLCLKQDGTIAAGKKLTVGIYADSTGDPGSIVGAAAGTVLVSDVPVEFGIVEFTFATPVELAADTLYHIVLEGDYDVSSTNYVAWRSLTGASGGNENIYDSAWGGNVATETLEFYIEGYAFADVSGKTMTAMVAADVVHRLALKSTEVRRLVRVVLTLTSTTSLGMAVTAILSKRTHPVATQ